MGGMRRRCGRRYTGAYIEKHTTSNGCLQNKTSTICARRMCDEFSYLFFLCFKHTDTTSRHSILCRHGKTMAHTQTNKQSSIATRASVRRWARIVGAASCIIACTISLHTALGRHGWMSDRRNEGKIVERDGEATQFVKRNARVKKGQIMP